jgi:hypothetical protein
LKVALNTITPNPMEMNSLLLQWNEQLAITMKWTAGYAWAGFELTLVVIGTDCISSFKSNYHTMTHGNEQLAITMKWTAGYYNEMNSWLLQWNEQLAITRKWTDYYYNEMNNLLLQWNEQLAVTMKWTACFIVFHCNSKLFISL